MRIKSGDQVRVIAGKDKGKEGRVIQTLPKADKVIVEGINLVKKHQKPSQMQTGGIVEVEAPLHVSNVQLLDTSNGQVTRVGYRVEDGKKVRVSKKSNEVIK